jgi:acyl-CoA synthetase (AMP-forming)/AMP-acid ligase II
MTVPVYRSLVELLRQRARNQTGKRAFVFLASDGGESDSLTYGELDQKSRSVAAKLQRLGVGDERALLLYPPGLEFVVAFFGCLYAGVVAVPVRPPHPARPARTLSRLPGIVASAEPRVVLGSEAMISLLPALSVKLPQLAQASWLATDRIAPEAAAAWSDPMADPDTLALLQYTSGSTAEPKGVVISHSNLCHNLAAVYECEENDADSVSVTWLPCYHDMGLIEGMLEPVYGGYTCYQMAPISFLQRPVRWLEAISRYAATNSGAPNFAYDLCVKKTTAEQRQGLDLRSWRVAYNGAEPIRRDTMRRFHRAFAGNGFRWRAFYPVYGLAEATLVVSSGRQATLPVIRDVDGEALGRDRAVEVRGSNGVSVTLVSCGPPAPDTNVIIVHPDTRRRCEPSEVGEIWVSGPGVSRGYWRRPQETRRTLRARLAETDEGPFLRTGDLGLLWHGELFVTGRLKDVIIIRGRKHYAQDIEATVEQCHPAIRSFGSATFAVETAEGEGLAVLAELKRWNGHRKRRKSTNGSVIEAIREAVAERHEIEAHAVTLLAPGAIPRTTSGKLRRRDCRNAFLERKLEPVEQWVRLTASTASAVR